MESKKDSPAKTPIQTEEQEEPQLDTLILEETTTSLEEIFSIDDHIFNNSNDDSEGEVELEDFTPDPRKSRFQIELTEIFKTHQCSHMLVHDILVVAKNNGHPELPTTATTLFKCEDNQQSEELIIKIVGNGQYWHRGIQNAFEKWDADVFGECVEIDAFIDGFPIKKSSLLCGWPILGAVVGKPNWPVLLFGLYAGYGSPKSSDELIFDFAMEAKQLIKDGIRIGPNKILKRFVLRGFLGDAPARAYLLNVKYHNSYNGCTQCDQVGYIEEIPLQPNFSTTPSNAKTKKAIRYQTEIGTPRTDMSFKHREDKLHHHEKYQDPNNQTILEKVLDFPMVSKVPIDFMQCMDLSVTKKSVWRTKKTVFRK
jgi:hypothetical protein